MRLWRILTIGVAFEAAGLSFLGGVLGVAGRWNGWADAANIVAWLWMGLGLLALVPGMLITRSGRARWLLASMATVGVAGSGLRVVPELVHAAQHATAWAGRGPALRLLTLNAWDENGAVNGTVAAIMRSGADVVLLQERAGLRNAVRALSATYPVSVWCQGPPAQYVIFSKRPVTAAGCVAARGGYRGGVALAWATIAAPDGRPATIVTTHLDWPVPPGRQASQSSNVAAILKRLGGDLIVAGDFNTPPWTWRMADQDRSFAPLTRRTRALPTWPARIARLDLVWPAPFVPIDHLYADPHWTARDIRLLRTPGSDHLGILTSLSR
jgi:endonuclease/exonuclease/phosphatase (EEP) superfamily protein YafD